MNDRTVLVHLASGIGNIVMATPLLAVLARNGFVVDVHLNADYPGVEKLFDGWNAVRQSYADATSLPLAGYAHLAVAVPPFYWPRFRRRYAGLGVQRPPDALFYENEQAYYLQFARYLGCDVSCAPCYALPSYADRRAAGTSVVLAPGSKPMEMTTKRWPFFAELAAAFDDVAVVGTKDDLLLSDGTSLQFPSHVRSFVGRLSLKETASVLARAAVVVANDCGLGHLAGALGVPTILLFGPTPDRTLGRLPANVKILRTGLQCEPCWFSHRFHACSRRIDCLQQLSVESVGRAVNDAIRADSAVVC